MSQQTEMSFKEFRQRFQTEEACEEFLFEQRWPEGFVCTKCGGHGCYRLRGRREYVCRQCRRQSSVTAGTVMHHTHLPLTVWFWAITWSLGINGGYLRPSSPANWKLPTAALGTYCTVCAMQWEKETKITSFPALLSWMTPSLVRPHPMGSGAEEQIKPARWQRCRSPARDTPSFSKYRFPNWTLSPCVLSPSKSFVPEARSTATPSDLFVLHSRENTSITTRSLIRTAALYIGFTL